MRLRFRPELDAMASREDEDFATPGQVSWSQTQDRSRPVCRDTHPQRIRRAGIRDRLDSRAGRPDVRWNARRIASEFCQ